MAPLLLAVGVLLAVAHEGGREMHVVGGERRCCEGLNLGAKGNAGDQTELSGISPYGCAHLNEHRYRMQGL